MNGEVTIRQLLVADAAVAAMVPPGEEPSRLAVGALGVEVALPALAIRSVSETDRQPLSAEPLRHVRERVQVSVLARSAPELAHLCKAVKRACLLRFPLVAGISHVVVLSGGAGPYFMDDERSLHIRTMDFMVSYNEPA